MSAGSFIEESVPSDEASGVFKEESCATYTSAGSKASAKNAAQSANWSAGKAAAAAQQAQWSVGPEPSAALPASAQGDAGLADTQGSVVELKPDDIQKRYLRLLNTGRLASRQKHARSEARRNTITLPADEAQIKSVYEADIARLRTTAKSLSLVEPIPQHRVRSAGGAAWDTGRRSVSPAPDLDEELQYLLSPSAVQHRRVYVPGPGSYTPLVDRFGGWEGAAFGFGTGPQRLSCQDGVVSPGPAYSPTKNGLSTSCTSPTLRFGKSAMGSRYNLDAERPSNHPHWNPGPGRYDPVAVHDGGSLQPGVDGPKTVFGTATKLVSPQINLAGTVFLSPLHSLKENLGIHSPGPGRYSPERGHAATHPSAAHYSINGKTGSYFDYFTDHRRATSPGPVYNTSGRDRRGNRTFGHGPRAAFGKGVKSWAPEDNLSASVFISDNHARVNQGIHSPGPIYSPQIKVHIPTPMLSSGQIDRMYNRFEPGRLA